MAMLLAEDEAEDYGRILARSLPVLSCGSLIELVRVATLRRGPRMRRDVDDLLSRFEIEVVPVDRAQAQLAAEGHARFGKGRGAPPAVLNFGDLFAYALARHLDAPLLFKGDDFSQTDVRAAFAA
jgi:ribonuclease VapC